MKLFVFHTPELTPTDIVPDCAIAIDVLRATTTIASALANGAASVRAFRDVDELLKTSEQFPAHQRVRAGERGGKQLDGFEFGNSPLECTPDQVKDRHFFISTTNGTRCLERIKAAKTVLTAALVNRQAVVDYLLQHQPETVWMVGSGWEGSYALEDTVCAGAIIHALAAKLEANDGFTLSDLVGNDEAVGAVSLYRQWQDNLLDLLHHASHGHRLLRLEGHADLAFCAQLDTLNILPMQGEPGVLMGVQ
ncbi:MAG: 2-phosphosulfolactate phosphatase family protein [Leptolyngbyaceae bacterium]|nr:2-phosphosulfolactate phosphatase family protein [Leptolyngbyaceae bacterium]